jgi:rsbT co-antagonist protein RsbR
MTVDIAAYEALQAEVEHLRQRNIELERLQEFTRVLLENLSDGVVACDATGELVLFNQVARAWHGVDVQNLPPEEWASAYDLYAADGVTPLPTEEIPLLRAFSGEHVQEAGMTIVANGQAPRQILANAIPLFDTDGQKIGAVAIMHDITVNNYAESALQLYKMIVKSLPIGVMVFQLEQHDDPASFRLSAANPASKLFSGIDLEAEVGRLALEVFPNGIESGLLPIYAEVVRSGQTRDLGVVPYGDDRVGAGFFAVQAVALPNNSACILFENVTERKRAEAALRQSITQEETIRAQAAALAELSTPLIPLNDKVVVMPLIGSVDSRRAQQVIETLLHGIAEHRAEVAILDITGVPIVDTQVANALVQAAQAVKLLGAQVVLSGIRPEVAQTLVGLGTELRSIVTRSTLQSGIAYAVSQI